MTAPAFTFNRCPRCNWTLCDDGTCGWCVLSESADRLGAAGDALYETAHEARGTVAALRAELTGEEQS